MYRLDSVKSDMMVQEVITSSVILECVKMRHCDHQHGDVRKCED